MSIYALEGPDGCGKSTLFDALQAHVDAKFIRLPPLSPALFSHMAELQIREESLWKQLYDPKTIYICDRHPAVSAPVYDEVFKRSPRLDYSWWYDKVVPVYINVRLTELRRRHASRGDVHVCEGNLPDLRNAYKAHLANFNQCIILSGPQPSLIQQFLEEAKCA